MGSRLLIVEDDTDIAFVMKDFLKKKGHQVTWASTGKEGIEDFQHHAYDLVIVDLMLPELDGFAVCKHVRLKSNVPLLMISARSTDKDKIAGFSSGADDYLTKPFSLAELDARVSSHLRRYFHYQPSLSESANPLVFEGLYLSIDERQAYVEGERVPLTSKEFELLVTLATQPFTTFSKKSLYEHVWHQKAVEDEHTVTVHVKKLRKKLRDSSKSPQFIETVWGTGYRFIGEQRQ